MKDTTISNNPAISKDFFGLCQTHETFNNSGSCAIPPTFFLLKHILTSQYYHDNQHIPMPCEKMKDWYRPHTGGEYWKYLLAARDIGLMDFVDGGYQHGKDIEGKCREYKVTELGVDYVLNSDVQYLERLFNDPIMRQKNKAKIRKKKQRHTTYADFILEYTHDLLYNLSYNKQELDAIVSTFEGKNKVQQHLVSKMLAIETRGYCDIKISDADGRIVNDFTMTKTDMRRKLKYKNMKQKAILDLRSAHPTFLAVSLLGLSSYFLPLGSGYCHALDQEVDSWNKLFCNLTDDPREVIGKEIGYNKSKMKTALILICNGEYQWYPELMTWLRGQYPLLMKIYDGLSIEDKKHLGNRICAKYEANLIVDPELYRIAESMNLKLGYENDGFAVFCDKNHVGLEKQMEFLKHWLTSTSLKRFGVPVVVKVDYL